MKPSKLFALFMIGVIAAVALFGCAPAATQAPATQAPATHKVAMITSGSTNDMGWNYNALQGIQQIKDKYGWEIAYTENAKPADQANIMRQYAQQGYDLIFAHGFEYGEAILAVNKDFPNTMFAQINATTEGDNVVGTNFRFGELGYFTGMAAGLMTKNNKIGIVAAVDAPQVTADTDTMKTGALSVNPNADVSVSFVGDWADLVKGQQVTQAQIDRGVDILIIMGNDFTPPAIELAKAKGIKVIAGWTIEAYPLAPETIIVSAIQDVPGVYVGIADQLAAGTLKGNTTSVFGFAEGKQYLGKWGDTVPQEVKDKVNQAVQDYLAGKLDIGVK